MPLGSPIGSNRGIRTRDAIEIIIEGANVPVVVDAGLGAPSHAAEALEMGADAVLVNTAIAVAGDPAAMAAAFKKGVEAGREAFLAGLGRARQRSGSIQSSHRIFEIDIIRGEIRRSLKFRKSLRYLREMREIRRAGHH